MAELRDVLDDLTARGLLERLEGLDVSAASVKLSLRPPAGSGTLPSGQSADETFRPGSRAPETFAELAAMAGVKMERET